MTETRTCIGCGQQEELEDIGLPPLEPGDDFYEEIQEHEIEVAVLGHRYLCGECVEELEAAYTARPEAGTLAEVLRKSHQLEMRMYAEAFSPETREAEEVFPNLEDLGGLPAKRKALRDEESLANVLRRVGKAAAIYFPETDEQESHFWVFQLNDSGRIGSGMEGHYEIVHRGAANAIDYAPDGTRLVR